MGQSRPQIAKSAMGAGVESANIETSVPTVGKGGGIETSVPTVRTDDRIEQRMADTGKDAGVEVRMLSAAVKEGDEDKGAREPQTGMVWFLLTSELRGF